MKKVCVDARLWGATGIGTFLQNILPHLNGEKGFTLHLLCRPQDQEALSKEGFTHLTPIHSKIYSPKEQIEIPLKMPSCDLYWAPHFNQPFLPIRAKKRLTTIHDFFHLAYSHQFSFFGRTYAKKMYATAVNRADHLTFDSRFIADELLTYVKLPKAPISVIPIGVNATFVPCLNVDKKKQIVERYKLPSTFFLMVGNFKPHKNLKIALEAIQNLRTSLVLIGMEKSIDIPHVHSISGMPKEDLPVVYSLAQALLFPSLYEGFGLPPLEAMACGCPAIVSRAASIPEVCGEAAYYIDSHDSAQLRQAMELMIDSPKIRDEWVKKGLKHAKSYPWHSCIERYLKIIYGLIDS